MAMRALLVVVMLAAAVGAAGEAAPPVRVDLLTGRPAADGTLQLGVRLTIEPGWHVYWRHPGEAGLATAVRPELPSGWTAGELAWPLPERFVQPGDIVGYGYSGEVVLLLPLAAPSDAEGVVGARVSWLACRERCVLGEAAPRLRLPQSGQASAAAAAELARWRERLPRDGRELPARTSVSGELPARGDGAVTLWLHWREPPRAVEYFPAPGEALQVRSVTAATRGATTRIDLAMARQGGGAGAARLDGLVVRVDGDGRRTGYVLATALPAS